MKKIHKKEPSGLLDLFERLTFFSVGQKRQKTFSPKYSDQEIDYIMVKDAFSNAVVDEEFRKIVSSIRK